VTDVNRVRRSDTGNPEVCNIYTIHRAFSENAVLLEIDKGCRSAAIGCIDCKKMLFENINKELAPVRERALALKNHSGYVIDSLKKGARECSAIAKQTMDEVRKVIGLYVP